MKKDTITMLLLGLAGVAASIVTGVIADKKANITIAKEVQKQLAETKN